MGQLVATGEVAKSRGGAAYLRRASGIQPSKKPMHLRPTPGRRVRDVRETVGPLRQLPSRHTSQVSLAGAGLASAGAAGSQADRYERGRSSSQRHRADLATGAVLGGSAGHAAFLGGAFNLRRLGHKYERERPEGMSRAQHTKVMRAHNKAYEVPSGTKPSKAVQAQYFRNYPEGLPATKYKRALGNLAGRRGLAIRAGVIGSTGMTGMAIAHGRREPVRKALYQREERTSPTRALGFLAGGTLAAYGFGHSKMVGSAIARGVKMAQRGEYDGVAEAMQRANAARGSLRAGMAPGEAAIRRVKALNDAIERVPRAVRPEVALVAGTMLAGHATPVRRTHYRPVSTPVY